MSEFGISNGWYKYPNDCNDNGVLLNVYHTTKCYVKVKKYNYYDNTYNLITKEGLYYDADVRRNISKNNCFMGSHKGFFLTKEDKLDEDQYISP